MNDFGWKALVCTLLAVFIAPTVEGGEIVLKANRQEIEVRAVIDREKVKYSGEEVTLTLSVKGPGRVEVEPPRPLLSKASAQAWRVREKGLPVVEKLEGGYSLWKQEFELSPFEGDPDKIIKVTIELAPLQVKAGNQLATTITVEETAAIEVEVTIGKDRKLKDITSIEKLPPPPPLFTPRPKPILLVGLAIAIILIIGAFVLIIVRRKRPEEPPLTGAPRALHDLAKLRKSALLSTSDFTRISDIVRTYLQECFEIPAVRLTTSEALARLQKDVPAFAPFIAPLQTLLDHCDVAKFAGASAGPSDCIDCIDRATNLIEQVTASAQNQISQPA